MRDEALNTVLEARNLTIGYRRRGRPPKVVAEAINVGLHAGELICLLGPNGSGKSTLIKTLAGMHAPLKGEVTLFGDSVAALTPKVVARKLSTVLTDRLTIGNLDVFTLVSFGRSPYTGWLGRLREKDEQVVRWAIEATGLQPLRHRDVGTLSDGERQKAMIARALAQDTDLILLDEPTAHLDLPNRVEIMRLLRKLARETGKGILLSTHELDLALKAGDMAWLINNERQLFAGVPEDLVLGGTFETAFAREGFDYDRATGSFNLHEPSGPTIVLQGNAAGRFWTQRALKREGFVVADEHPAAPRIEVVAKEGRVSWTVRAGRREKKCYSVNELLLLLRETV